MPNIWPNGIPDGIREMLKEELLSKKLNPILFLKPYEAQMEQRRELLEMQMAAERSRQEADVMAMSRIDPQMHDDMVRILRHDYPEIYEHSPCYGEFNHRFERLIGQGCPLEEAVHRTAKTMIERDPDLRRSRIGMGYTAGRATANPYRGSISDSDYAHVRSHHEMRMRGAREEARIRQMQQMSGHSFVACLPDMIVGLQTRPKKKKLTILEQLQADVDVWLKDSLKLTHLENIKL